MNTIKLNDVVLGVESYNKNTYFTGETISSNANCAVITNDMTALNELAEDTITVVQIYHDEDLIYDLQNVSAKIDSINEYLNGDRVNVNVNLTFTYESQELDN